MPYDEETGPEFGIWEAIAAGLSGLTGGDFVSQFARQIEEHERRQERERERIPQYAEILKPLFAAQQLKEAAGGPVGVPSESIPLMDTPSGQATLDPEVSPEYMSGASGVDSFMDALGISPRLREEISGLSRSLSSADIALENAEYQKTLIRARNERQELRKEGLEDFRKQEIIRDMPHLDPDNPTDVATYVREREERRAREENREMLQDDRLELETDRLRMEFDELKRVLGGLNNPEYVQRGEQEALSRIKAQFQGQLTDVIRSPEFSSRSGSDSGLTPQEADTLWDSAIDRAAEIAEAEGEHHMSLFIRQVGMRILRNRGAVPGPKGVAPVQGQSGISTVPLGNDTAPDSMNVTAQDIVGRVPFTITGRPGDERPGGEHRGLDIAVPRGTPVMASLSGTVTEVGYQEGRAGWYVKFKDRWGREHNYFHLDKQPDVSTGDEVTRGTILGVAGATGRATGPHVHYELR